MKYIPANTAFKCIGCFTLQPKTPSTEVTISISVDGVTFTTLEDTFSGAQVFKDGPFNTWIQCSADVYCSESTGYEVDPAAVTVSASAGRIVIEKVQGQQQIVSGSNVDRGTAIWIKFVPTVAITPATTRGTYRKYVTQRFNSWSDGNDENPRMMIVNDPITLTANIDILG